MVGDNSLIAIPPHKWIDIHNRQSITTQAQTSMAHDHTILPSLQLTRRLGNTEFNSLISPIFTSFQWLSVMVTPITNINIQTSSALYQSDLGLAWNSFLLKTWGTVIDVSPFFVHLVSLLSTAPNIPNHHYHHAITALDNTSSSHKRRFTLPRV